MASVKYGKCNYGKSCYGKSIIENVTEPYNDLPNSKAACFNGSDRVDMIVDLRVQYCRDFFRIHLRPKKNFKDRIFALAEQFYTVKAF